LQGQRNEFPKHIAVIGGGRWSRVIAGVLCDIMPSGTRLSVCSPSNPSGWEIWKNEREAHHSASVVSGIHKLFSDETLEFVVVARAARDNAATAVAALEAGKSVLVEKPFALCVEDAKRVLIASDEKSCTTGLVFLFASNLWLFRSACEQLGPLQEIQVTWHDPVGEQRYDELKQYDPSVNCLLDVFPHIWSLLRIMNTAAQLTPEKVTTIGGGRRIHAELQLGDVSVRVDIEREALTRQRILVVKGRHGQARIDFSNEPGTAVINGVTLDVATGFSSPLSRQLTSIIGMEGMARSTSLCRVENAIEAISIAEQFLPRIRTDQCRQIRLGLRSEADMTDYIDANYALR